MLTCACIANADETAIATPCLLHAQWARATYGGFVPVATRPIAEAEVARHSQPKVPDDAARRYAAARKK